MYNLRPTHGQQFKIKIDNRIKELKRNSQERETDVQKKKILKAQKKRNRRSIDMKKKPKRTKSQGSLKKR